MKLSLSSRAAFTLIELLVVISIIAILASLAVPAVTGALTRGQMTGVMNNARQLTLATQTMALDSFTSGEGPGWPGDSGANWGDFCKNLIDGKYLTSSDLRKIASAPGVQVSATAEIPDQSGLQVYPVKENNAGDTIFISTANWTGPGSALSPESVPFGDKGFVIYRKGGDGNVYQARQSTNTTLGQLPEGSGFAPIPSAR
jgi:prepilin-type N-terminal cleavage/methylation domain-containing protein